MKISKKLKIEQNKKVEFIRKETLRLMCEEIDDWLNKSHEIPDTRNIRQKFLDGIADILIRLFCTKDKKAIAARMAIYFRKKAHPNGTIF